MQEYAEIYEGLKVIRRDDMILSVISSLVSLLMVIVVFKASPSEDSFYMQLAVIGSTINTVAMAIARNKLKKERQKLLEMLDNADNLNKTS